jgi:hypothetical protein
MSAYICTQKLFKTEQLAIRYWVAERDTRSHEGEGRRLSPSFLFRMRNGTVKYVCMDGREFGLALVVGDTPILSLSAI